MVGGEQGLLATKQRVDPGVFSHGVVSSAKDAFPSLVLIEGHGRGRVFVLDSGEDIVIGRGHTAI